MRPPSPDAFLGADETHVNKRTGAPGAPERRAVDRFLDDLVSGKSRVRTPPPRMTPTVLSGTAQASYHHPTMDSLKELLNSRPAVIARTKQGQLIPGYLDKGRLLVRGILKMSDVNGEPLPVDLHKLKGLFFVRDFTGDRDYLEEKTLNTDPGRRGLRARIRFEDNESLEGGHREFVGAFGQPGLFLLARRSEIEQSLDLRRKDSAHRVHHPRRPPQVVIRLWTPSAIRHEQRL